MSKRFEPHNIFKTWYEIARTPNTFEDENAFNVTASYSWRPDGSINVINKQHVYTYKYEGKIVTKTVREDKAIGIARIPDPEYPTYLMITFGPEVPSINYEIIYYEPNYSYMIIRSPSTEMLWILSATPSLPPNTLTALYRYIQSIGFDITKLKLTYQSTANSHWSCVVM